MDVLMSLIIKSAAMKKLWYFQHDKEGASNISSYACKPGKAQVASTDRAFYYERCPCLLEMEGTTCMVNMHQRRKH
jgi:hypothetical protein